MHLRHRGYVPARILCGWVAWAQAVSPRNTVIRAQIAILMNVAKNPQWEQDTCTTSNCQYPCSGKNYSDDSGSDSHHRAGIFPHQMSQRWLGQQATTTYACTVSQLMMIKHNGPDLDSFNTQPATSWWWKDGPKSCWPSSQSYGPGKRRPESEMLMTEVLVLKRLRHKPLTCFGMCWFVYTDHVELKKQLSLGDQIFSLATKF